VPPLAGLAVELLAKSLGGQAIPERTLVQPTSYPPVEHLRPLAVAR